MMFLKEQFNILGHTLIDTVGIYGNTTKQGKTKRLAHAEELLCGFLYIKKT